MNGQRFLVALLLGFLLRVIYLCTNGESLTCLTVYKEGGAPAVFQSPKCPRWTLSNYRSNPKNSPSSAARCQSAMRQGRRKSQEDRTLCALDIRIPFPCPTGVKEVTVGIIAVFDGHNGDQASDMASKLLLEYFTLHTYFLLDTTFSFLLGRSVGRLPNKGVQGQFFQKPRWEKQDRHAIYIGRLKLELSAIWDESFHLEILKEALLRAIHDIDVAFGKDAFREKFDSGSTAAVILLADTQVLVANIGDSKAFLCSELHQSSHEAKATLLRLYRQNRDDKTSSFLKDYRSLKLAASSGLTFLIAKELTEDHHPDRDDERSRVEAAGGYVSEWGGVARVNGRLAVSRAIGDVYFKSYGVVSLPEVNDWQPLTINDSYLVAATDGVFEKLKPQDICDIFWELHTDTSLSSEVIDSSSYSLADRVVDAAFDRGSLDNMAAIVVPVKSFGTSQSLLKNVYDGAGEYDSSALGYIQPLNERQGDDGISEPVEMEHAYPVVDKFERLLVERKKGSFGCFYLSENLNEIDDYSFWVEKDDHEHSYKLIQALPSAVTHTCGGVKGICDEQSMCMFYGFTADEDNGQCINPEGFTSFLGLLGSIPLHGTGPDEHTMPDSRYILKKRYGRGSYGEVWLAFQWNCSKLSKSLEQSSKDGQFYYQYMHFGGYDGSPGTSSFADNRYNGTADDKMFILKRIMVERGAAVYLSGLREKYFGEVFLNASTVLRASPPAAASDAFCGDSLSDTSCNLKANQSMKHETEIKWSSQSISSGKRKLLKATYEDGLNHIARFVESFESRSNQIWLVFRHEGVSLSKLLYTAEEVINSDDQGSDKHLKRVQILHPSKWWHWLKTTEAGQEEMRNLILQLLKALKSCHDRNITHRDVKPENMVVCFEDQLSGRCSNRLPDGDNNYATKMRLIDFGSALDDFTMRHLYGSTGPSRAEQTSEYAPPEALLNVSWYHGPMHKIVMYDMWSVGVIILELILGSPDVFQINSKTRALLDQHLEGWNENLKELAYKLRSFMEICILIPGIPTRLHHNSGTKDHGSVPPVPWKCSEDFFAQQIKRRDPLNIGFPNIWALRLVRELLQWNPEDRLSVDDALQHPYFSRSF